RRMALMFSMVPYFVSKVDLSRLQFPTEAHAPEQIKHRLVVHDLRGGHQYRQDDAAFASIDHRMHMIAQVNDPAFQTHRRSIWIGRTDTEISPTLVIMVQTANLSLRFPGSGDPVVPLGILSAKLRHRSGSERATGSGVAEGAAAATEGPLCKGTAESAVSTTATCCSCSLSWSGNRAAR